MKYKEIHVKDHDFHVHDCVVKLDRPKQQITFSFKNIPKSFDPSVSGNKLIDLLMKQAMDGYFGCVRVRGLSISYAEWERIEVAEEEAP